MRVLATHSIRQVPLHFLSRASPCATRFRTSSSPYEALWLNQNVLVLPPPALLYGMVLVNFQYLSIGSTTRWKRGA